MIFMHVSMTTARETEPLERFDFHALNITTSILLQTFPTFPTFQAFQTFCTLVYNVHCVHSVHLFISSTLNNCIAILQFRYFTVQIELFQ